MVFGFHSLHAVMYVLTHQNSMDSTLADKVLKKTRLNLQKSFPICHACPKCLAALLCGSAFQKNGSAFNQELDGVGKTQVDWQRGNVHCVLIQHLKISRIVHTIYFILEFLNLGCEFKDSVSIFDQSSSRKFIECKPFKSLRLFHPSETFHMSCTKIPILF